MLLRLNHFCIFDKSISIISKDLLVLRPLTIRNRINADIIHHHEQFTICSPRGQIIRR